MSTITNSKSKKIVAVFVGLVSAVVMMGGAVVAPASAATVEELTAQINSLLATIAGLQTQLSGITGGTGTCAYTFTTNLKVGSTGTEVMNLQKFLNKDSATQIASGSDAGAPGYETSYFGERTKAAVIKFQDKYTAEILTPVGLTAGTGYFGASSRAKANAMCSGGPIVTPPTGTGLTVTSATQPANSLAPQGAARVPFTRINLTNNSGAAVTVNNITVERSGLGVDAVFSGIVLVDENNVQIGTSKTLNSNHQAAVGDPITLNPGQTKTITVAGNMAASLSSQAGQVVGLNVVAVNTSSTVSGTLPITGAQHTINSTLTLGSVSTSTSAFDPGTAQTKNIGDTGVKFSGIKFTAGSVEHLKLYSIRFRQVGSVSSSDLSNVMVYVDGTAYPTTVDSTGKYYTATFSGGLLIEKGLSKDVYIQGDITGSNASSRTVDFDLDKVTDVYFVGQTFGYGIAPSGTYTPWYNGNVITVSGVSVTTIGKANEIAAQNVAAGVSGQVLGGFVTDIKGEAISVQSMVFTVATSGTGVALPTSFSLYNDAGAVVAGPVDMAAAGTVTFTDTVTFPTGRKVWTIKGKLPSSFTNGGTVILSTTPSSGWTNITGQTTGNSVTLTQGAFSMNTMTVKAASLAIAVSSTPAAQTVVAGAQGVTLANYQFDATQSGEDIRFSSLGLTASTSAALSASTILSSCQLFDGSTALNGGSNVVNPTITTTAFTATAVTFTLDSTMTVPKGTVKTLALKCNVASGATGSLKWGITSTQIGAIAATGVTSSVSVTPSGSTNNGQLMTLTSAGTVVVSTDASSPSYKIAAAGSTGVTLGSYKFRAANESVNLTRIGLGLGSVTASSTSADLTTVTLWNGATQIGSATFVGANRNATSTLTSPLVLTKDTDVIVTVKGDLAAQGASEPSNPGALLTVDVDVNTNTQGTGVQSGSTINATGSTAVAGVRVFKSYPTVAQQTSGMSSTLIAQSGIDLYRFSIAANAAGEIALNELTVNVATSSASTANGTTSVTNLKVYAYTDSAYSNAVSGFTSGQIVATIATLVNGGDNVAALSSVLTIPAGQTYYFKVVGDVSQVAGTTGSAGTVTTRLSGDASYPSLSTLLGVYATGLGNFIWSPVSTTTAATTNIDWTNGFNVAGLPSGGTNSFTLSK